MSNPFEKSEQFIEGKQTERTLRAGTAPSPPSSPGELVLNRKGDMSLSAVTNNEPSLPVDSDEYPTLSPQYLDTKGRLRTVPPKGITITGTIISGTVTQTVSLAINFV
jgi:hypothetical protein